MPSPPKTEDVEKGLYALALSGGSAQRASEVLALMDPPANISVRQLGLWKVKYAERYAEIHANHVAELETVVLQQVREAIMQAGALQSKVLEKLLEAVESGDLEAKDLANVLKSAGVTLGINVEKMLLLTNRPTVIAEKRDVAELLESLSRRIPGLIVGDAEDITDAKEIGPGNDNGRPG